ncbi:unnamed protein product [Cuscuta campestris]|uniref:Uncharacterized protein n=1 Tax=Cuscuta campestris TaxID=132261 RepID=A0A484NR97_9ASTE|nr:unnamed protein product [Cuscuta campestris]
MLSTCIPVLGTYARSACPASYKSLNRLSPSITLLFRPFTHVRHYPPTSPQSLPSHIYALPSISLFSVSSPTSFAATAVCSRTSFTPHHLAISPTAPPSMASSPY